MISRSDFMCPQAMMSVYKFSISSPLRPKGINRRFSVQPEIKNVHAFQSAKKLKIGTVHKCHYHKDKFIAISYGRFRTSGCNFYKTTFPNPKDALEPLHPSGLNIFTHHKSRSNLHTTPTLKKVIPFNLADIGEGIREVVIKEWNPKVRLGEKIEEFDIICEVESDKASVSITSRYSGIVFKVYHQEGDVAFVGNPLIDIQVDVEQEKDVGKKSSEIEDVGKDTAAERQQTEKAKSTQINDDKTECNNLDRKIESSLITSEFQENRHQEDNFVKINDQMMLLNRNRWKILATPAVRRMIKQYDINTKHLRGSGKQGRVLKEDIIAYLNSPVKDDPISDSHELSEASKTPSAIPIQGYVKGMFKSMTESNKIPTLRLSEEVDTTLLKTIRTEINEIYHKKFDLKVTYMPFFIKALSLCISEYPILNANIDSTAENILINPKHNICIAIDTKHGLTVPNIKDVDQLSIGNIARELNRLQSNAHARKVPLVDLQGGTIAMSNVGNVGGVLVQPIVMPQQVCIVAFGRMVVVPRYDSEGSLVPRSVLTVTWAADHRVVDGATVARAATLWKSLVENPLLLLAS